MAIKELKRHTSPAIDQILAEFIEARVRTIHAEVCELINSTFLLFFP
jgi:hypothetical protein